MSRLLNAHGRSFVTIAERMATAYEDATPVEADDFVIPENLSTLSDEELNQLHEQAITHFDALYGDGSGLSDTDVSALSSLTDGIEALNSEIAVRAEAETARAEAAAELAARIRPVTDEVEEVVEEDEEDEETPAEEVQPEPELVTASASRPATRIPMSAVRSRAMRTPTPVTTSPQGIRDVLVAGADLNGYASGAGVDWDDVARGLDRRLASFPAAQYATAQSRRQHIREQHSLAILRKPIPSEFTIQNNDPAHVDEVIQRAMNERRLPGGSLVAAGGWCAPSETLYDLLELESNDGLFSLPEIGVARGGIQFTPGPSFSAIYSDILGFSYTEAQDIAGKYGVDTNGVGNSTEGSKPCYHVTCPEFEEVRLGIDGLCIEAGLMMSRGYPELIARTIRGALVAHNHRMSARLINAVAAGSTAVTMPASQVGATAPILTAIELQVEHYRYTHRLGRGVTLEAVFPYWVHGAVRSDLSRRLGVDLLDVSNARINGWFAARGVAAQFVYDWQALDAAGAAATTAWPATLKFLLYAAGTWVRGTSDIITLDTIYDSVLLGDNNYTALFTEEGWFAAMRGHDSRVVTVNICPDGATAGGVLINCDGSEGTEAAATTTTTTTEVPTTTTTTTVDGGS